MSNELVLSNEEVNNIIKLLKKIKATMPKNLPTLKAKREFIMAYAPENGLPIERLSEVEPGEREVVVLPLIDWLSFQKGVNENKPSVAKEQEAEKTNEPVKDEPEAPIIPESKLKMFEGKEVVRVIDVIRNFKRYKEIIDVDGVTKIMTEEAYNELISKQ